MEQIVLAFDIGIKNLAFALVKQSTSGNVILQWNNINLLAGGTSSESSNRCKACSGPACWISPEGLFCKGCATGVRRKKTATFRPVHAILTGAESATLPKLPALRKLCVGMENHKKASREIVLKWLGERYILPWKAPKARNPSMTEIRRAISAWLTPMLPTFATATLVRLENQPVLKGPTMKSIQMIIFTLIGERLEREHAWTGQIQFVHASHKTAKLEVEAVPDVIEEAEERTLTVEEEVVTPVVIDEGAAYRARKKATEEEVEKMLSGAGYETWKMFYDGQRKKNDLADALLMACAPVLRLVSS
jgi:hypothetical protein